MYAGCAGDVKPAVPVAGLIGMGKMDDLAEFYPGSKEKRRQYDTGTPVSTDIEPGLGEPRVYLVNGKDVEFFTIGQVANAMGRKAVTLRNWEARGVIPVSVYSAPSDDPRGRRRLYTRPQAEGMVKIAREEGMLDAGKQRAISKTNFTQRVIALFEELYENQ